MLLAATKSLSDASLVAPYRLIGLAALSVDSAITLLDLAGERGVDHVLGAEDVGLDALERVVFGGRHLLQRRRVDHDSRRRRIACVSAVASRTSPMK